MEYEIVDAPPVTPPGRFNPWKPFAVAVMASPGKWLVYPGTFPRERRPYLNTAAHALRDRYGVTDAVVRKQDDGSLRLYARYLEADG